MTKQVISTGQFIDEVNKRLPNHAEYKSGMRVFLVPIEGKAAWGYDFEPNDSVTRGVVAGIAEQVRAEFEIDPRT